MADAVTDPALLAKATAGPDWACRYCGTHQPCGMEECANCGAPAQESRQAATFQASRPNQLAVSAPPRSSERVRPKPRRWPIAIGAILSCLVLGVFLLVRSHVVEARVVARAWEHTIVVERYQIVQGEGFAEKRPAGAFDVVRTGERHHHDNRVQDGTERESYTEQVACGEDCSTTSVTCTENGNGFKTCSGGDRVCRTRYCSETRYRDVPRYKNVPVYEPWYRWRAWEWKIARSIVDKGGEEAPTWPGDARIELNTHCGPGEKERSRREAKYEIFFQDEDATRHPYRPKTLAEFTALPLGTAKRIRVGRAQDTEIVEEGE